MRNLIVTAAVAAAVAASLVAPSAASAQLTVSLRLDLPVVLPAMVVIEPGVQVVPQVNEEVFFVEGFYWVRRDTRWYRSHDYRSGWVVMEQRAVPARLVKYPPGQYRKWSPPKENHGHGNDKNDKHEHHDNGNHGQGKGNGNKGD